MKNQQDIEFGVITEVFETGANDVIVAKNAADGRERLIPFIDQVVIDVNLAEKKMLVDWDAEF